MGKKPNPELIDDENPEWTAADVANARPASEVLLRGRKMVRLTLACSNSTNKLHCSYDAAEI